MNSPLRVLNLMKTTLGGVWAMRQMREQVKLGLEVHAALPDRDGLWLEYRKAGIHTHLLQTDFPLMRPWLLPARSKGLLDIVKTVRPDIVHSHFVGTTLTMRLALRSEKTLPRVFQVPGPLHLEQSFFRKAEIATAQENDYWIGTCSATRKHYLQSGISPKRVFLCFYGTSINDILKKKRHGRLRGEIGVDQRAPIVGMVAFIYAPKHIMGKKRGIKGHEDLIDAVALAAKRMPDLKVVFIGGPWDGAAAYASRLKAYAADNIPGRAFFLGTRHDVPELYPDFDVAVHPSHSENLGGAGESLLLGVPTIATNVGGFPDLIIPGETGILVPPRHPEKLAEAILAMLADRKKAMEWTAKGRARVMMHCDVSVTAAKVSDIYNMIVAHHRIE